MTQQQLELFLISEFWWISHKRPDNFIPPYTKSKNFTYMHSTHHNTNHPNHSHFHGYDMYWTSHGGWRWASCNDSYLDLLRYHNLIRAFISISHCNYLDLYLFMRAGCLLPHINTTINCTGYFDYDYWVIIALIDHWQRCKYK